MKTSTLHLEDLQDFQSKKSQKTLLYLVCGGQASTANDASEQGDYSTQNDISEYSDSSQRSDDSTAGDLSQTQD